MLGYPIKSNLLQCYRLGVLLVIAWLIRDHHLRLRVQGDWPISVSEVRAFLPEAHRLRVDNSSDRKGLIILDKNRREIGYSVRTMPDCRDIIGYSGPTDALVVFDEKGRGVGVAIRHSYDTPSHVEDVTLDYFFMKSWNGKNWNEIAKLQDFDAAGIYAVSGATRTSEALRESITHRLHSADVLEKKIRIKLSWGDAALIGFLLIGCLFAFCKKKAVQRWRWIFSVTTVAVLGLYLGDLIAQSLLIGWLESRIPWEQSPGLAILVVSAFIIPWFSGQPVYCQFICPHGNLQRWTMKLLPARWKRPLPDDGKWLLRWTPVMLLAVVLAVSFLRLDLDLAGIEPFDAYLIQSAGRATIAVALAGLSLSLLFPMSYCKYACPTGWLLEFLRRRTGNDRFGTRDWMGLILLSVAVALFFLNKR